MLKVTQSPSQPIRVQQKFTIAGTASPEDAGKPINLTIDNQFKTTISVINPNGSWQFEFVFQSSGDRRLKISVDDESVELAIKVLPPPVRLSFTNPPKGIETEETVILQGQAEVYKDGDELVLIADGKYELGRPRVKNGKWQAAILLRQPGKRLIEIRGNQDRVQIELPVLKQTIPVWPRSTWINEPTPVGLEDLQPKRITIHHTEYPTLSTNASQATEIERLRAIRQFHVDSPPAGRGWSDIGYHFVIMPSGRVYEARSPMKRGAHDKVNDGIGIAFDGNYTSQTITPAQFQSAVLLCAKLFRRYGLTDPLTPVATPTADFGVKNLPLICGHQDRVATSCPGTIGGKTVRLSEMRQSVKNKL